MSGDMEKLIGTFPDDEYSQDELLDAGIGECDRCGWLWGEDELNENDKHYCSNCYEEEGDE